MRPTFSPLKTLSLREMASSRGHNYMHGRAASNNFLRTMFSAAQPVYHLKPPLPLQLLLLPEASTLAAVHAQLSLLPGLLQECSLLLEGPPGSCSGLGLGVMTPNLPPVACSFQGHRTSEESVTGKGILSSICLCHAASTHSRFVLPFFCCLATKPHVLRKVNANCYG